MIMNNVTKIEKPWGYELIIAHTKLYVAKILFVKAGQRLSKQYHVNKDETMYVQSGQCVLELDGKELEFEIGKSCRIKPNQIHRITAITDTTIIEASTTELDDVVRVEDDFGR